VQVLEEPAEPWALVDGLCDGAYGGACAFWTKAVSLLQIHQLLAWKRHTLSSTSTQAEEKLNVAQQDPEPRPLLASGLQRLPEKQKMKMMLNRLLMTFYSKTMVPSEPATGAQAEYQGEKLDTN